MNRREVGAGRALLAFALIGFGVLFLVGQFVSLDWLWNLWPLFVLVPGLVFLYFAVTGKPDAASLAIPGAIITGTGLILLFQSITGRWESWAYIWALYPVFLGLGLMYMGRRTDNQGTYNSGQGFVQWGLIAFLVLGSFFEIFIFGGFGVGRFILPLALIGIGAWLLFRPRRVSRLADLGPSNGKPKRVDEDPFFTGAPSPRPRGTAPRGDSLRQRIDEALAEDEEPIDEA